MLVLSRKRDTSVRIGPNIEIKVLSIRNGQVRLGIEAPLGIRIWRDEIWPGPDAGEREQRGLQTWAPSPAEVLQP